MGLDDIQEEVAETLNQTSEGQDPVDKNLVPCEGMQFSSIEEAYAFYNAYAKAKGFGTRRHSSCYSRKSNAPIRKVFVCGKQGFKKRNDPGVMGKEVRRRPDTRVHCKAQMVIRRNVDGKWLVTQFRDIHSHELASSSKVGEFRSHKKLTSASKELINAFNECGIEPSRISKALNVVRGGEEHPDATPQDCTNHLQRLHINNINHGCMRVVEHFQGKAGVEVGFFIRMEIDESNLVRSVFWADSRSRLAYMEFADVVVFDVSYKTKAFSVPFASLSGVNHHRQPTLFGCAMLADETEETFTWLFETWLACMWGKKPQAIIADQDEAVRKAIAKVFPDTRHIFCSWQIEIFENMHLNQLKANYLQFNDDYEDWKHSDTIEDCESLWVKLMEKYEILDNSWLASMYNDRYHWIQAYVKDCFLAGVTSSQRCESRNAFFDGFVNAQTPLSEFVQRYDSALAYRRAEEASEDHRTLHVKTQLHAGHPIEEQARGLYTRKMFNIFQEEFKHFVTYMCSSSRCEGEATKYEVTKYGEGGKCCIVTFQVEPEISASCSCKKFESEGILCRHILRIFFQNNILVIPDKYVLFRWTIGARYTSSASLKIINDSIVSTSTVTPYMKYCLHNALYKIADLGSTSPAHWNRAMTTLKRLIDELENVRVSFSIQLEDKFRTQTEASATSIVHIPQITVQDPPKVKSPRRSERLKLGFEENVSSQPKKRKCSVCHGLGHYMTTCPMQKGSNSQATQGEQSQAPQAEPSDEFSKDDIG